ncbi:MAG: VOC family protein [Pseudomonadota bacterium]
MNAPPRVIGLGEVALRVSDLTRAAAFYQDVLGLREFERFDGLVFLEVGAGEPGHPQVLALFAADWPSTRDDHGWEGLDGASSPLHHVALSTALDTLPDWERRLEAAGVAFNRRVFEWAGWRSLFLQDPDGNVVELVAVDPSLRDAQGAPD